MHLILSRLLFSPLNSFFFSYFFLSTLRSSEQKMKRFGGCFICSSYTIVWNNFWRRILILSTFVCLFVCLFGRHHSNNASNSLMTFFLSIELVFFLLLSFYSHLSDHLNKNETVWWLFYVLLIHNVFKYSLDVHFDYIILDNGRLWQPIFLQYPEWQIKFVQLTCSVSPICFYSSLFSNHLKKKMNSLMAVLCAPHPS